MCVSPIYNESRLCSLEAVNHAQWAVIREKVFIQGRRQQAACSDWQITTWQFGRYHLPLHSSIYWVESSKLILSKRRMNTVQKRKEEAELVVGQ